MERRCRLTYETSTECNLVRDNVGVYCASGSFATASLVRSLHALTRSSKQRIKKLHLLANDETVDLWAMDEVHFQTFNNMGRGVECGYHRRSKTPCYHITPLARALPTSAQCVFATANSFLPANSNALMR